MAAIEEGNRLGVARSLVVYPNPVSTEATIGYSLPRSSAISCVVYDAAGGLVSRLPAATQAAGKHQLTWNAAGVRPGIYFCRLIADGATSTARLSVVR